MALERAGFADVAHEHVVDRRGPGDASSFEPSEWWPTFEELRGYHEAGALWLRGRV